MVSMPKSYFGHSFDIILWVNSSKGDTARNLKQVKVLLNVPKKKGKLELQITKRVLYELLL